MSCLTRLVTLGGGIRIAVRGTPTAPKKKDMRIEDFPELQKEPTVENPEALLINTTVKNQDSLLASIQFQFEGDSDAVSHCSTFLTRDATDPPKIGYLPQYPKTVISNHAEYHKYKKQCKKGLPYLFDFSEDIWRCIITCLFDGYRSRKKK